MSIYSSLRKFFFPSSAQIKKEFRQNFRHRITVVRKSDYLEKTNIDVLNASAKNIQSKFWQFIRKRVARRYIHGDGKENKKRVRNVNKRKNRCLVYSVVNQKRKKKGRTEDGYLMSSELLENTTSVFPFCELASRGCRHSRLLSLGFFCARPRSSLSYTALSRSCIDNPICNFKPPFSE